MLHHNSYTQEPKEFMHRVRFGRNLVVFNGYGPLGVKEEIRGSLIAPQCN